MDDVVPAGSSILCKTGGYHTSSGGFLNQQVWYSYLWFNSQGFSQVILQLFERNLCLPLPDNCSQN